MTCIRRPLSYWSTCPCPECVTDRRRKRKLFDGDRPYRIPSEAAWDVLVDRVTRRQWTALALASACGLEPHYFTSHVAAIRKGQAKHIGPNLAPIILRMGRPTEGEVGAIPTRRRLQALARIGWSLPMLRDVTGVNVTTLSMIRSTNVRCKAVVANAVADAYDQLHMTPGSNTEARKFAKRAGWPGPLAWDCIDTDDAPQGVYTKPATPTEFNRERTAKRLADLEHAVEHGHTLATVCDHLELSKKAVLRWCQRNERRDLWAALAKRDADYDERRVTDVRSGRDAA